MKKTKLRKIIIFSSIGLAIVGGITAVTIVSLDLKKIEIKLETYDYSSLNLGKFNGKIIRKNEVIQNGHNYLDFTVEDNNRFISSFKKHKGYVKELDLINTNWEKETENFNRWYERYYIKNDNNRFFVLSRDNDSSEWSLAETHRTNGEYIDFPMTGDGLSREDFIKIYKGDTDIKDYNYYPSLYNFDFLLKFYSHTPETAIISENKDYIDLRYTLIFSPPRFCTLKDPMIRINRIGNNNWKYEIVNQELKNDLENPYSDDFMYYKIEQMRNQC